MRVLAIIFFVIVGVIVVLLIAALFIKNEYTVERQVTINKPRQDVFNYIRFLKNQDLYSKWVMTDPNMQKNFKGTDGTVGFVYAWDSKNKNAGKGEQEIMSIVPGQKMDVEVRFEKPFKSVAHTPFATDSVSQNQTRVTWTMEGKNAYPMNLMNMFIGNMLGKDMDTSLATLKGILEKS